MSSDNKTYNNWFAVSFFLLMAGSVFIVSGPRFDLFETYRQYWTLIFGATLLGLLFLTKAIHKNPKPVKIEAILHSIIIVGILECVYALLQVVKVLPSFDRYFAYTGSFENPSVFAMLLSICVPISIWFAFTQQKKYFWIAVAFGMFVFTLFSESRTGVLATLLSIAIICLMESARTRNIVFSKKGVIIIFVLVVLLISCLYLFKVNSANGRLLIWRVSLSLFRDKPLFGWGSNGFTSMYMTYQAQYLNAHPESPFMLLADNPSNPFNEFVLVLVNYGLLGLLLVLGFIAIVSVKLFRSPYKHKSLLIGLMITLIVWSLFSYPFSIPFVWIITAYISIYAFVKWGQKKTSVNYVLGCLSLTCTVFFIISFFPERKWKIVSDASINGRCEEMLPYFTELSSKLSHNGRFMYNWAAELHYARRYEESAEVFNNSLHLINDYDVQMLLADDYQQMGDTGLAVHHYDIAASMVPSRFLPYYYKMNLYLENGDTVSAVKIADKIINKEVKVKSSRSVQKIIEEANKLQNQYSFINQPINNQLN